ncbi:MAG: hypothetical protein PF690_15100 [Deltaproteobacteria bacterium]|jgi:hypothetical protein|nr:hypothetical protein [Deltaproteobacteria bacterium]
MKIPFEDRRTSMERRWTDIIKINDFRFHELYELIEGCNELGKDEFFSLKELIEKKLHTFNTA